MLLHIAGSVPVALMALVLLKRRCHIPLVLTVHLKHDGRKNKENFHKDF